MNLNKDQIIKMLADGIPGVQIAASLGVDESYISQLRNDPEVQEQIQALAGERTAADMKFDDLLAQAEMTALERISRNLPHANMGQSLMAFRTLNDAKKRRDATAPGAAANQAGNVTLVFPQQTIIHYVTNRQNEIVEVEGKTMLSATPKSLDDILAARAGNKDTKLLPMVTDLELAAERLDALVPPRVAPPRAQKVARRLPPELSADIL